MDRTTTADNAAPKYTMMSTDSVPALPAATVLTYFIEMQQVNVSRVLSILDSLLLKVGQVSR